MRLFCGGYRLAPAPGADGGADATLMANVTCMDPGGAIPMAVVRRTAAQRENGACGGASDPANRGEVAVTGVELSAAAVQALVPSGSVAVQVV